MAVQDFRLPPSEFWRMTPSELDLLTRARVDRDGRGNRLSPDELAQLERIGREAMEKEAMRQGVQ